MIRCITRNDMKFGDYFIPARTKAVVINKPSSPTVNAPGIWLMISVKLFDIFSEEKRMSGIPINLTQINNELQNKSFGHTDTLMVGITLTTNTTQVYLDAGDQFYSYVTLYEWQVKKIFNGTIPENLTPKENSNYYYLESVVDYLENEFAEWVKNNCHFKKLTKREIESGYYFDGAEPGDKTLSAEGLRQFDTKKREYQERLETTGFTYDFKGGLIWD